MSPAGLSAAVADSTEDCLAFIAKLSPHAGGICEPPERKENTMIATTQTIPAVAYLRRSTDRQEQSLGDQRLEISRHAEEHGYEVIREYVDDAISGTSADQRPGFQQMVSDAEAGQFKAVIVWNSDRFSRGDVTETEYYRYLLRKAGVTLLSVTEDYLHRESFDGDILRTVKQFQNRQFSISLSQNTLRGQISAVQAKSDPGRPCPYGYDREIVGPDGKVIYRVRFCPGRVREVMDVNGNVTATYRKGQSLRKPGKECKGRMVLSTPDRVQVVKDIFAWCLDGVGFKGIADRLNTKGIPSPRGGLWNFTTIKSLLMNPIYRGDLVWNRRTESKFYSVKKGRVDQMKSREQSAKPVLMPEEEWIVVQDAVAAIVTREDWDRAQVMVIKRRKAKGGKGKQRDRWLLSGVLVCGNCGQPYWGERKRKGHIPGRAEVVSNYYTCAGRRRYGKSTCPQPASVKADALEAWVLDKVRGLVFRDTDGVDAAVERFVASAMGQRHGGGDTNRLVREIAEIDQMVAALTSSLDPANLAMLNDRLTQLRKRREYLEADLRTARLDERCLDADHMRQWAYEQAECLADMVKGRRDPKMRRVIASYVDEIRIFPETKTGELVVNAAACGLIDPNGMPVNDNDRPEGRSCVSELAGAGFAAGKAARVAVFRYRVA
jgi:DNA invertase Pin-like site-specific DNA recombinase